MAMAGVITIKFKWLLPRNLRVNSDTAYDANISVDLGSDFDS